MQLDAIVDWLNSLMNERRLDFCNTSLFPGEIHEVRRV